MKNMTFKQFISLDNPEESFFGGDIGTFTKKHHSHVESFIDAYEEAIKKEYKIIKISSACKLANGFLIVDNRKRVTWHSCRGVKEFLEPDNCQICHGARGGTKGNENIIDGIVMCDYCHVDRMKKD